MYAFPLSRGRLISKRSVFAQRARWQGSDVEVLTKSVKPAKPSMAMRPCHLPPRSMAMRLKKQLSHFVRVAVLGPKGSTSSLQSLREVGDLHLRRGWLPGKVVEAAAVLRRCSWSDGSSKSTAQPHLFSSFLFPGAPLVASLLLVAMAST